MARFAEFDLIKVRLVGGMITPYSAYCTTCRHSEPMLDCVVSKATSATVETLFLFHTSRFS